MIRRSFCAAHSATVARLHGCAGDKSSHLLVKTQADPGGTPVAYIWDELMNTRLQKEDEQQPMNTTIFNYPGFQMLPKGIKQMLLASEAYFFDQPVSSHVKQEAVAPKNWGMNFRTRWTLLAKAGDSAGPETDFNLSPLLEPLNWAHH